MSATTTGGAAASTASDGVIYTGFGTGSGATATAASGSTENAAARLIVNFGQIYGLAVVAAGIFAGFTVML